MYSFSLSGLSPFGGQNDDETMENIRKCNIRFPGEVFDGISDEGKDFIQKLLVKNRKYDYHFVSFHLFIIVIIVLVVE